jgi:hypothetical protein
MDEISLLLHEMVHVLNKNSVIFFSNHILISKLPSISAIGSSLSRFHSLTLPSNELDARLIIAGSCVNVDCGCQLIQQAFTV